MVSSPPPPAETHVEYFKSAQEPVVGELTAPREKLLLLFFKADIVKCPINLYLYPYISVKITSKRILCAHWTMVSTETHNWSSVETK